MHIYKHQPEEQDFDVTLTIEEIEHLNNVADHLEREFAIGPKTTKMIEFLRSFKG